MDRDHLNGSISVERVEVARADAPPENDTAGLTRPGGKDEAEDDNRLTEGLSHDREPTRACKLALRSQARHSDSRLQG
jgi:hypothetical protein